jgi:hypothetical protein
VLCPCRLDSAALLRVPARPDSTLGAGAGVVQAPTPAPPERMLLPGDSTPRTVARPANGDALTGESIPARLFAVNAAGRIHDQCDT